MHPLRPVEPAPAPNAGPMPPRTPALALFGFGAAAVGGGGLFWLFPLILRTSPLLALVGVALGLLAIALGILALRRIARQPIRYEGRPMAIAAIVLGVLVVFAWLGVATAIALVPSL